MVTFLCRGEFKRMRSGAFALLSVRRSSKTFLMRNTERERLRYGSDTVLHSNVRTHGRKEEERKEKNKRSSRKNI